MKKNATIYDFRTGYLITDGLQSAVMCDAAIQAARRIAREQGYSVIVADYGTKEVYRITPRGYKWRAPKWWPQLG